MNWWQLGDGLLAKASRTSSQMTYGANNTIEEDRTAEELVQQGTLNTLPEENEDKEPTPMVELLTIRNLQKRPNVFEDSIVFLKDLDSKYEHRSSPRETFVMRWHFTT